MTWLLWAFYKTLLLFKGPRLLLHSSGLRLWIIVCASRVHYKSKSIWLASNVNLVESESGVPLIPLVGELVNSNVINICIYLFFKAKRQRSGTVLENFKPRVCNLRHSDCFTTTILLSISHLDHPHTSHSESPSHRVLQDRERHRYGRIHRHTLNSGKSVLHG